MYVHIEYPNCFQPRKLKVQKYSEIKSVIKRICILLSEEVGDEAYNNKNIWGLYKITGGQMMPGSTIGQNGIKVGAVLKLKKVLTPCSVNLSDVTEVSPAFVFPIFDNHGTKDLPVVKAKDLVPGRETLEVGGAVSNTGLVDTAERLLDTGVVIGVPDKGE